LNFASASDLQKDFVLAGKKEPQAKESLKAQDSPKAKIAFEQKK
jgi:hypothetical protein